MSRKQVKLFNTDCNSRIPVDIKFYYSRGSNCSERVKWVLDHKQITYHQIDADELYGSEKYFEINPFGRVPSMIIDGMVLNESMVMVEFLEENFRTNPLLPKNPISKAEIRQICEIVNSTIHPMQNSKVVEFFKPGLDKKVKTEIRAQWVGKGLTTLTSYLWKQSKFAAGTQFSLADIFVTVIYNKGISLGLNRIDYPKFESHWMCLLSDPSISYYCPIKQ